LSNGNRPKEEILESSNGLFFCVFVGTNIFFVVVGFVGRGEEKKIEKEKSSVPQNSQHTFSKQL